MGRLIVAACLSCALAACGGSEPAAEACPEPKAGGDAFDPADGGPRYATTYLPLHIYRQAFRYFRHGYASAMTISMFLLTGLVLFIQYRLARRWRLI